MIVASDSKREIGKFYVASLSDSEGIKYEVGIFILREATKQEYIDLMLKISKKFNIIEKLERTRAYDAEYFYDVSMD